MPQICTLSSDDFLKDQKFQTEVFGPFSLIVKCKNHDDIIEVISNLEGQLTGTIMANIDDKDFL